jgi:hypothetical protein
MPVSRRSRGTLYPPVRYHITTPTRRTTVTVDKIISDLIAIKLGIVPIASEAHGEIRKQLETLLLPYHDPNSPYYDPKRMDSNPTELVTRLAVLWLVGKRLSQEYEECVADGKL